jgi:hypothetical protein
MGTSVVTSQHMTHLINQHHPTLYLSHRGVSPQPQLAQTNFQLSERDNSQNLMLSLPKNIILQRLYSLSQAEASTHTQQILLLHQLQHHAINN